MANPIDFRHVPLNMIHSLIAHDNAYYKLAGYIFLGYYEEKILENQEKAEYIYRLGLEYGDLLPNHGQFFKSFGYLGLGRILIYQQKKEEVREVLNLALKYAGTNQIKSEVKELLSKL